MTLSKRLFSGCCVLGGLLLLSSPPQAHAAALPGLVTIVSPTRVSPAPADTQAVVHLEVAFGKATTNGAVANPATFKPKLKGLKGLSSSALLALFTNVTDTQGNVIGKKADVTVPIQPGVTTTLSFKAAVKSLPLAGKTYKGGDSVTITIRSNLPPTAKLVVNPSSATFKYPVTLDARDSTDADGDSLTYTFDFGDGSALLTTTNPVATHAYVSTGPTQMNFTTHLTVNDGWGAIAMAQGSLSVHTGLSGATQAMMMVTSPLNSEVATVVGNTLTVNVNLSKASSGADPDLSTFKATLNGVNVASSFTPVKDPLRGNTVVALQASIPTSMLHMDGTLTNALALKIKSVFFTSLGGTTRTVTQRAKVLFGATAVQPPTAAFTANPSEPSVGEAVTFDGSGSNDPQGKPLTYAWDFGDGQTLLPATATIVTHAYASTGSYITKLTVSDGTFSATADNSANPVVVRDSGGGGGPPGTPALTVIIPEVVTPGTLDLGDLKGQLNIHEFADFNSYEEFPAWVEKCVEIKNTGTGLLSISSVTTDSPDFQVSNANDITPTKLPPFQGYNANIHGVTSVRLAAGESYYVSVRFSPRPDPVPPISAPSVVPAAANGPRSGHLTIVTNDASATGTQTVALTGNVVSSITGAGIALMHTDTIRTADIGIFGDEGGYGFLYNKSFTAPLTQTVPGAVLDVGVAAVAKTWYYAGIINQGDTPRTITGVEVKRDDGSPSPDFSAYLAFGDAPSVTPVFQPTVLNPGQSFENATGIGDGLTPYRLVVTFTPTNTGVPQRLSANLIIHTDQGGDLVMGLTGLGVYDAYYNIQQPSDGFEFKRTILGGSTNQAGSTADGLAPATVTLKNIGRESGTVTASMSGVGGGAAPSVFSLDKTSLTLATGQSGTFTVTYTPSALGHSDGILKVDTGLSFEPPQFFLMHGFCKGSGAPGIFGTPGSMYTFDGSDYNNTVLLNVPANGQFNNFSQLDGLQDPFMTSGNTVDMSEYDGDWSDLVMLAGTEYTIDGGVLGPYTLTTPGLTSAAIARLQGGGTINPGAIESHGGFIPGANGNVDIQADGFDSLRIDGTPDGIVFYTEVASNATTINTPTTTTAVKWLNHAAHTGGVVSADLPALLGHANFEMLDMRVIKTGTGYRAFVVFDAQDTSGNQLMADADLSSSFAVTAHKELTGTPSSTPESDNGTPMVLDKSGAWYSAAWTQNANGSTTIQIYKEDLHTGSSSRVLFGQTTVGLLDNVNGLLLDNQGNVVATTDQGICVFTSAGAFAGYTLSGNTFYADSTFPGNAIGSGGAEIDMSDFTQWWMDK